MKQSTRILVLGLSPEAFSRLLPLLGGASYDVDTPSDARLAMKAVAQNPYALIFTNYPLEGVKYTTFLDEVRGFGSPCRQCGLIALVAPQNVAEAKEYIGQGLNSVVSLADPDKVLSAAINQLRKVEPRVAAQLMVNLNVPVEGKDRKMITQTVNLSRSGMLVRTHGNVESGLLTTFQFEIPGLGEVEGVGEVARVTNPARERITGVGIRFIRLDDEGAAHLEALIAQALAKTKS